MFRAGVGVTTRRHGRVIIGSGDGLPVTSGLAAWYKYNGPYWQDSGRTTPATTGDTVHVWDDSGPGGYHAPLGSGGNKPILETDLGRLALKFHGYREYFTGAAGLVLNPNNLTIIARYTPVGTPYGSVIASLDSNVATTGLAMSNVGNDYVTLGQPDSLLGGAFTRNQPLVHGLSSDTLGRTMMFKNTSGSPTFTEYGAVAAPLQVNRTGCGLGSDNNVTNRFSSAVIDEVIFYNRRLSNTEMASVASYLYSLVPTPTRLFPRTLPLIICDGNSLTIGVGTGAYGNSYPSQLQGLVGTTNYRVMCAGMEGQSTQGMINAFSDIIAPALDAGRSTNLLIAWELTNSIFFGVPAATVFNQIKTYCNNAKAALPSIKIIVLTGTKRGPFNASMETDRQTVNNNLLADFSVATSNPLLWRPGPGITYADLLYDVGAEANFQDVNNTTYFTDTTHMTTLSYGIVGTGVDAGRVELGL